MCPKNAWRSAECWGPAGRRRGDDAPVRRCPLRDDATTAVGPDLSRRSSPRCVETLHVLPRWLSLPRFEGAGCDVRASCPRAAPNAKYPRNAMTTALPAHRRVVAATALMTLLMLVCTACGAAPHPTATVRSCNGSSALCSRPLNEVIFPGTHNSFAASNEPGWYFANQTYPIARQLHDGIRALLIDIHYGVYDAARGRVRTDLSAEGSDRNKVAQQLPASALRVADRVAGGIGLGTLKGKPEALSLSYPLRARRGATGAMN